MRKWIPLLIVAAAVIASALVYARLPDRIPTHWELSAHPAGAVPTPNGWSSRLSGAWALPVFLLGMWALVIILPKIDPRGSNYAKFSNTFEGIIVSIMLFMLGMHIIILGAALGYPVAMDRVFPVGLGVLFIVIGNLLPRARPNWFVGIRTPWTLSSDRVWEKTHRFGGHVFVVAGILMILSGVVVAAWARTGLSVLIALCAASVVIYSYVEWKREQNPASAPR
jgi:uncharacterized membrane protein